MPGRCCVCSKSSEDGRTLHRFPIDNEPILEKWLKATGMDYVPENSVLCSSHFEEHCFHPDRDRCQLKINAVPTLFTELQMADSTVGGPIIVKSEEFASDVNVNHPDEACENRVTAPFCEVYVDDASAFSPTICDSTKRGPTSNFEERKRMWLSVDEKIMIIRRLDSGETNSQISATSGIPTSTITNISKKRADIFKLKEALTEQHGDSTKRRRINKIDDSEFDRILFLWFKQHREAGLPVSGAQLRAQALALNKELNGSPDFKASHGWLSKFKTRHGIMNLSIQDKKRSADTDSNVDFCAKFKKIIAEEGFSFEHIYNADETGLMWKAFPNKSLADKNERTAEDLKLAKECITLMVCANAAGTNKIPLFCIGKAKKPRCFRNVNCLPVIYANQTYSLMDKQLFIQWYTEVFLPAAKSRVQHSEKILLLLKNAPSHPPEVELNAIDHSCQVMYLPPNDALLIQPMNQGVIVALKRFYRTIFLRELLLTAADTKDKISVFKQKWNLVSCFQAISAAWNQVTEATLSHSWNNIFGKDNDQQNQVNNVDEIQHLMRRTLQCDVPISDVMEWLDNDTHAIVWEVQSATQLARNEHDVATEYEDDDDEEEEDQELKHNPSTSAEQAYESADRLYNWMSRQRDTDAQKLRAIAEMKMHIGKIIVDNL